MSLDSHTYLKLLENDNKVTETNKNTAHVKASAVNVNRLIMDTLTPLGYPVSSMRYNSDADTYIVFLEYNQASRMNADDVEVMTKHFYQVDVFSSGNYLNLVNDVRRLMIEAGFGRMFESETYDDDMNKFRKLMRFNYETTIK